jgi:hypothetical protein
MSHRIDDHGNGPASQRAPESNGRIPAMNVRMTATPTRMSKRTPVWLAWCTWVLYVALTLATLVLESANDPSLLVPGVLNALVLFAFATVGALIAARRPGHRIGWLMCVGTLLWAAGILLLQYATYALVTNPGALPGGDWAGVLGGTLRSLGFGVLLTYVLLLFPDGHLPSARWRPAVWFAMVTQALGILAAWLAPAQLVDPPIAFIQSPLHLPVNPRTLETPINVLFLAGTLSFVVCGASVFSRFRRARGDERQQLKWFAYAALVAIGILVVIETIEPVFRISPQALNSVLFSLAVAGFPVAIGIAVLRYRLYDIDILIRRTVAYGMLTALLLVIYFASVVVLQQLFVALTGQRSEAAIVVSTLAIAALFVPLRNRIQQVIDRRFFRQKYNAAVALESFAHTARDEVDAQRQMTKLLDAVEDTLQPERMALWTSLSASVPEKRR